MGYDLLGTVENGGCSAKLPAAKLNEALKDLPIIKCDKLLVDIDTHDDAGVYKISDDIALIQTTDFFPPVCSDPYEFGQIAAANALSDIYAMGGEVLTALNLVLFPEKVPLEVLGDILRGGQDKVAEAGGVIVGGHTIEDTVPKYGLAVTGIVHPDKVITNAGAKPGDILILTKAIGTGTIAAGKKLGLKEGEEYRTILENMKLLNRNGAAIMQKYSAHSATDITGFGLSGHAMKMAIASNVTIKIISSQVPVFPGTFELIKMGCIPNASFRNLDYTDGSFIIEDNVDYDHKMMLMDAQTSGGLLIAAPAGSENKMLKDLIEGGYPDTAIVGEVVKKQEKPIWIV